MTTERWDFLLECLDLPDATGVGSARWEHFQYQHLNDDSVFRIENKARQIAWSWTVAAEGIANAILYGQSSAYVSINQDEAAEKIRYARAVYDGLYVVKRPKIVRDSLLGLELGNGARLLSLPARPPRGKARFNVYLDEFAHVQYDRGIYTAALPVISKGGQLRIGSSPMGAGGVYWEIYAEPIRRYPGYTRKATPWWEVYSFCRNVREARKLAPGMLTADRVEMFGSDRIKAIYANMPEEDFRQEYECEFVDEVTAWVPWDEIRAIQDASLECVLVRGPDAALEAIDRIVPRIPQAGIERVMVAGVDVGRTRNTSEFYVIGISPTGIYPLRLAITLDGCDFDTQAEVLTKVMQRLPVAIMWIDQNGIGRNLAETLAGRFPGRAAGVNFTNATKALWAGDAKMLIQQRKARIPPDRDLAYQIHSIKRKVLRSKNVVFDTESSEKHHADKWWALALALSAAKVMAGGPGMTIQEY